jgi:hypothetical protein
MAQITVTGYKIRDAMARRQLRIESDMVAFPTTLTKFAGEEKESPQVVGARLLSEETLLAELQSAQVSYNNGVVVRVAGKEMTLTKAIKLLGGANRQLTLWRSVVGTASSVARRRSYGYEDAMAPTQRAKDTEYSVPTLSRAEARTELEKAMSLCNALKAAVAEGNAKPFDVDVPPEAFDV